jgi:hypothetical protein
MIAIAARYRQILNRINNLKLRISNTASILYAKKDWLVGG